MRAFIWTFLLLTACGTEQTDPDWAFTVTVSNKDCAEFDGLVEDTTTGAVKQDDLCSCTDPNGDSCLAEITLSSETFSYELFFDGDAVAIEIDGQPFASGNVLGCELEYESPTWLATTPNGEVQWAVISQFVKADGASVCPIPGEFQFLGVEEYTVIESDNVNYPVGRVVRKVVSGHAKAVGGE
jgi:hypothetical protein